jgi:hypothetical protein
VLREVATDLNESSENLSKLTIPSIAEGGKSVVFAWKRLDAIDGEAIQPYKEQWRKWEERIGTDMQKMVDELSAVAKS